MDIEIGDLKHKNKRKISSYNYVYQPITILHIILFDSNVKQGEKETKVRHANNFLIINFYSYIFILF